MRQETAVRGLELPECLLLLQHHPTETQCKPQMRATYATLSFLVAIFKK